MTKLAIITGGARGIGRACALALAAKGLDIAIIDLLQPEMQRTMAELQALGRTARIYQADVSDHPRAATVIGWAERAGPATPAVSTTMSSVTSEVGSSVSEGTATSTPSDPVSSSDSSAISRNTRPGSVPRSNSVAISRVASIQDCRARDCS